MRYDREKRHLLGSLRREVHDERVLDALMAVRREAFVPHGLDARAYDNVPLPIGEGQTISQPLIVGIMLEALDVQPGDTVLDIGTGSGYQAALLSRLAGTVVSTERIASLAEGAREALAREGCTNVQVVTTPSTLGCAELGPYDAIVVAAAAPAVPATLLAQLKLGGRLVVPVGSPVEQRLARVVRTTAGTTVSWLGPCRFVPLIGADGWSESF
jgi:protein-L-isoaspartate(D-aspartate) O-methyltransferase